MALICVALICLGSSGCFRTRGSEQDIHHPTSQNMPRDDELADRINKSDAAIGSVPATSLAGALRSATVITTIGSSTASGGSTVFGLIEDLAVGPDGRLYVLDSRLNEVQVFTRGGSPIGRAGEPGVGPGALAAPEAMTLIANRELVIADRYKALKFFDITGDAPVYRGVTELDFIPEDFCVLRNRIFIYGWQADGTFIHEFTTGGKHVKSFGRPYDSPNLLVQNQLTEGPIECVEDEEIVVAMHEFLPIVYGYSADGELVWQSLLQDFKIIDIIEGVRNGRPAVVFSYARGEFDRAETILPTATSAVVLQIVRSDSSSVASRAEYKEVHTYVIDARTGEGLYAGRGAGILRAIGPNMAAAAMNRPFPHVNILSLEISK